MQPVSYKQQHERGGMGSDDGGSGEIRLLRAGIDLTLSRNCHRQTGPWAAQDDVRLRLQRIRHVDDACPRKTRGLPIFLCCVRIAGKEDKIDARERVRINLLDERYFVASRGDLPCSPLFVQEHHIVNRQRRLRQCVAQLLARKRRCSDYANPIWSAGNHKLSRLSSLRLLGGQSNLRAHSLRRRVMSAADLILASGAVCGPMSTPTAPASPTPDIRAQSDRKSTRLNS